MRAIDEIIVHCTATRPGFMENSTSGQRVEEIRRWHVDGNGWRDIGYHFLIDRDGSIHHGRPVEVAGAHVRGRNARSIGVSLFGGHGSAETDDFYEHFTPEQNDSLRDLLNDLSLRYGVDKISGHNEYAAKACPGFNVQQWLAATPMRHSEQIESPAGFIAALVGAFLSIFGKGRA